MSTKSIRPFSFPLRFPSHSFSSLFSIFLSASWLFFLTYSPLPVVCIFTTYQIKALGILQASLKHHLQQCFKKQCQESLWCGRRLHWFPYKVLVQNVWAHSTTQPKTGRTETHTHTHTPTTSEDRNTPPPHDLNRKEPTQAHCLKGDTQDDSAVGGEEILPGFRVQGTQLARCCVQGRLSPASRCPKSGRSDPSPQGGADAPRSQGPRLGGRLCPGSLLPPRRGSEVR